MVGSLGSLWVISDLRTAGVFFLFGGGRLALCRSQPLKAIDFYTRAHESQSQYRNLHHISFWEIAIANFCLWDIPASLVCWRDLQAEASVSRSLHNTHTQHDIVVAVVKILLLVWHGHLLARDRRC